MVDQKKYSVNELCNSFSDFCLKKNPEFKLTAFNEPVIKQLVLYFMAHEESTLNPKKGIYLCGPVGTGKTTLMRYLSEWAKGKFIFVSCRDIQQEFARDGFECLLKYSKKSYKFKGGFHSPENGAITYCFDDFGSEGRSKFYGNDVNVMEEVLQDRYNEYETHGMLTHMTSNIIGGEVMQEHYGLRVRDRIRGMFNKVVLKGETFRK